jgi:O-antigen/teichoic acid export membrane protein
MTNTSFTRAIGRNTIIQFVGKIGSTMLGLMTVAMIQRYLEPAGFGAYTTAMAYLGFFSVLADLGLYLLLARDRHIRQHTSHNCLANILVVRKNKNKGDTEPQNSPNRNPT